MGLQIEVLRASPLGDLLKEEGQERRSVKEEGQEIRRQERRSIADANAPT